MSDPDLFRGARLSGDFTITALHSATAPLVDAMGRKAIATTRIVGRELSITITSELDPKEWSVTIYHEVLEALTVGYTRPPASVLEFNEGDFERAAYDAHERFGPVSPEGLNRMLHFYGFGEQ